MNYVNAPLIAAERGIEVVEGKRSSSRDYTNLVVVAADGDPGRRHDDRHATNRHWLVRRSASSSRSSSRRGWSLLLYDDMPGVIGRIGTLFGAAGVNIANMTVSRNREGGKALMALSIDSTPPPDARRSSCARAWTRPM